MLSEANCNHDLRLYWIGHKPERMDERYSKVCKNLAFRLQHAEEVGLRFVPSDGFAIASNLKNDDGYYGRAIARQVRKAAVSNPLSKQATRTLIRRRHIPAARQSRARSKSREFPRRILHAASAGG